MCGWFESNRCHQKKISGRGVIGSRTGFRFQRLVRESSSLSVRTKIMINKDTFCALAYNGISVNHDGTLDPCCQYLPDEYRPIQFTDYKTYVSTVRQQMHDDHVSGRRHTGCRKCWREEELGLKSLRWYANEFWYKDQATPVVSTDNPLFDIELRFGNTCNLKCMMCDPKASSALYTERLMNADVFQRAAIPGVRVVRERVPEWWESSEFQTFSTDLFQHARRVNITGGEPFMIAETVDVLDRLLPQRNDVLISFNSNLTRLPKTVQQRLPQFPRLQLNVSLEGIGAMAEYLRYPCKWNEVDANIRTVIDLVGVRRIGVNHTLQHGSIYSLPALAEYCATLEIKMTYTMVQGIDCLKLDSVPGADCEKFLQWLETTPVVTDSDKNFLRNAVEAAVFDQQLYQDFRNYTSALDQVRGTSWDQVFSPSHA